MGRRIRKSSWLTSLLGVGLLMSSGLLSAGEDMFSVRSNGTVVFNPDDCSCEKFVTELSARPTSESPGFSHPFSSIERWWS